MARPYTPLRGAYKGQTFSSEWQYRNAKARDEGYINAYGKSHGEVPYNDNTGWLIDYYADANGLERGEVVRHSEFAEKYNEAKETGFSKEAHGPFAEWLEYIGVREDGAEYDVGQTPKGE